MIDKPAPSAAPYRWVVLAVGVTAQAALSSYHQGLPSIGPAIQSHYGLDLVRSGVLLTSVGVGVALTLILWGVATDRFGERLVLVIGLGGSSAALAAAALASGFAVVVSALLAAGMLGSVANTASGRAVMAWFGPRERGTALGIRQMATPLGGGAAAAVLPLVLVRGGVPACLLTLAAFTALAAIASALWLRPAAGTREAGPARAGRSPLRDPRIVRLALGGALVVAGQLTFITYVTTFLNQHRGVPLGTAAAVLAAVQLSGALARVGVGRLSDVLGQRVGLLRLVAISSGGFLALTGLLADGPMPLLLPVLLLAGFLSMVSNGLAFTATGEIAGRARAGTAMGFQNTFLYAAGVIAPILFGILVTATGWALGFIAVGLLGAAGWWVLRPLEAEESTWLRTEASA